MNFIYKSCYVLDPEFDIIIKKEQERFKMAINVNEKILSLDATLAEVINVLEHLYIEPNRLENIAKRLKDTENTYNILDAANILIEDCLSEDFIVPVYLRALDAAQNISDIDKVVDSIKNNINEAEWVEEFLYGSVLDGAITDCRAKIKI